MTQVTLTLPAELAKGEIQQGQMFSIDAVLTLLLLVLIVIGAFYLYNYFEHQPQALPGCDPQASLNFPDVQTYCQQYPMDQCCSIPAPPPPSSAPSPSLLPAISIPNVAPYFSIPSFISPPTPYVNTSASLLMKPPPT